MKKTLKYFKPLCYTYYIERKGKSSKWVMYMKGIFDARELAVYIKDYYKKNESGKEISPLKLQKSLYFCFAYWGGFMRKSNNAENKEIELNFSEYLYDNPIEAWVYGPVIPDVYKEKNLEDYRNNDLFKGKEYVQEFVDNVLNDILPVNDFKLVDISHEDQCWKKHFKKRNIFHNIEIPKEDIIREYANL